MGRLEPVAFESLERLGHAVVSQLRRRLEMIAVEMTEEQIRFSRLLGWQLLALFFSSMTAALAATLIIAAFWDTALRIEAIGWTLLVVSLASSGLWFRYRQVLRRKPVVFRQTIDELRKDAEALDPAGHGGARP